MKPHTSILPRCKRRHLRARPFSCWAIVVSSVFILLGQSLLAADTKFAFPLKLSANRRHLVDQHDTPFFVLGDTPWFIQKLKIEDVRMLMDDCVAKGFNTLLWNPYRIRRNAWWAVMSGASGYCAGTRLWRWETNWRNTLQARSTEEPPHILRALKTIPWWTLVPDMKHEFVPAGFGEWKKADYFIKAADDALKEKPFMRRGENADGCFLRLERAGNQPAHIYHNQLDGFCDAPQAMRKLVALLNELLPEKERIPINECP